MRPRVMIALLVTGLLVVSGAQKTVAQEKSSAENTNSVTGRSPQQQPSSKTIRATQTQVPPESRDDEGYPQKSDNTEEKITVEVWSTVDNAEPDKLSPDFAPAALTAAFRMQSTERKIENSIRRGFPLGEFWIQTDLEGIDDSLKVAALSVTNEADRQALQQLENQSSRLRLWSDWLIGQNRNLALTEYYISSSTLDNDQRFQNSVACTKFLISMLSSRTLADDNSCL